ncbi:DUF6883 domain-containing protein [Actinoplanes solisilvae]|uniref:DUF6883 domain-containing protein n=1 Tax=Actinoplanes solisilvae TaxID=2486853 RepID=UPI0013E29A85|nr:DUF6883 domain-containing protein [Actinoplanes solisilvae]
MTGRPRTPQGGDGGEPPGPHGRRDSPKPEPGTPGSVAEGHQRLSEKASVGRSTADGGRGGTTGNGAPTAASAPDFTAGEIDSNKITGYAMNPDHPVGRNKYRVINSVTGLEASDASQIERQIRDGVISGTPIEGRADQYGQRWAVDVPLTGPEGSIIVRTAWIVDTGSATPRLVTISFPKEKS